MEASRPRSWMPAVRMRWRRRSFRAGPVGNVCLRYRARAGSLHRSPVFPERRLRPAPESSLVRVQRVAHRQFAGPDVCKLTPPLSGNAAVGTAQNASAGLCAPLKSLSTRNLRRLVPEPARRDPPRLCQSLSPSFRLDDSSVHPVGRELIAAARRITGSSDAIAIGSGPRRHSHGPRNAYGLECVLPCGATGFPPGTATPTSGEPNSGTTRSVRR